MNTSPQPPIEEQFIDRFSVTSKRSVLDSMRVATEMGSAHISSAHLFLGVLQRCDQDTVVPNLLQLSGVTMEEARLYAQSTLGEQPRSDIEPEFTADFIRVLEFSIDEAKRQNVPIVELEHLFIGCTREQEGPHVGDVLRPLGLDVESLRNHLNSLNLGGVPYPTGSPLNELTEQGYAAIEVAHNAMRASFCGRISTAHLLLGLLDNDLNGASETLTAAGVDIEEVRQLTRAQIINDGQIAAPQKQFTPASKRALERARTEARKCGKSFIAPQHLLRGLLPGNISLKENLAFGNVLDDPLEKVWAALPVGEIERHYKELWKPRDKPLKSSAPKTPAQPSAFYSKRRSSTLGVASCGFSLALVTLATHMGPSVVGKVLVLACTVLLIGLGLGTCVTMLFSKSPQTKNDWLSAFAGFLVGLFLGLFIWNR
jgi:hypothetical protein